MLWRMWRCDFRLLWLFFTICLLPKHKVRSCCYLPWIHEVANFAICLFQLVTSRALLPCFHLLLLVILLDEWVVYGRFGARRWQRTLDSCDCWENRGICYFFSVFPCYLDWMDASVDFTSEIVTTDEAISEKRNVFIHYWWLFQLYAVRSWRFRFPLWLLSWCKQWTLVDALSNWWSVPIKDLLLQILENQLQILAFRTGRFIWWIWFHCSSWSWFDLVWLQWVVMVASLTRNILLICHITGRFVREGLPRLYIFLRS